MGRLGISEGHLDDRLLVARPGIVGAARDLREIEDTDTTAHGYLG
jgi:hypothetical protein